MYRAVVVGAALALGAMTIAVSGGTARSAGGAPVQARSASAAARTVWDGVYTTAQQQRGEPVYVRECSTCHGETLKGGEGSPPLTGGDFNERWNERTMADLFDIVRLTMPPPPDTPGRLTAQQYADVVAYILKGNGFPAGAAAELPTDREQLKEILITFTRDR